MWKYSIFMPCCNVKPGNTINLYEYDNYYNSGRYTYISDGDSVSPKHPHCAIRHTVRNRYNGSELDLVYDSPPILFREFLCSTCQHNVPPLLGAL